jgi:hypothetical protein
MAPELPLFLKIFLFSLALLTIIFLYFFPTIVAISRKKKNQEAIFIINFVLGWTFIGWIIALVWAVKKE